jgi:hypothetical protein
VCDVRFWRETFSLFFCHSIQIFFFVNRVAIYNRSQSNDGKKGKKRTAATEVSSRTISEKVVTNHARSHKTKANTKSTNLKSNDDNNGAGSLSGSGPSAVHSSTNNSTHTTSTTTTAVSQSIVKLSPAPSTGSARTSSPIVNVTGMKKYRDEPSTSRTPDMPGFGSVPTPGGLKFAFEQQQPSLSINTHHTVKESPPSSPGSEASARKRRKATPQASPHEKETKVVNGAVTTHHMLGNQLNPNSSMAKNMTETLNMEIEAHSIYSSEPAANLVGPQYPGRKDAVSKFWDNFILKRRGGAR